MKRLWTSVPEASVRWTRALACGVGAVLLAAAAVPEANDGAVVSLSVVPPAARPVVIGATAVSGARFARANPVASCRTIRARDSGQARRLDRSPVSAFLDVRYAQTSRTSSHRVTLPARPVQGLSRAGEVGLRDSGGVHAWRVGSRAGRACAGKGACGNPFKHAARQHGDRGRDRGFV